MAAVPSIGRATQVEGGAPPEADLTHALYEEYANQIFRYCLHQLGSREEAEDAVQSTFLNAFRGLKRGVVPELESAWLFKIAHNVCLSRRRSSWRRGRVESPADFAAVEELTPAPSRAADELIGLQDVLGQMPENQRRAILLREWQGLSYREIAAELELSQGAVETLIFRARRSLAAGLEEPPERAKRRLLRGADLGSLVAGLKALLVGGSGAAKIAAAVAVVSATTVAAADPVVHHGSQPHGSQPTQAAVRPQPSRPAPDVARSVVAPAFRPISAHPAAPLVSRRHRPASGHAAARATVVSAGASGVRTHPAHPAAPPTARRASQVAHHVQAAPGANGAHRAVGKSHPTRSPQSLSTAKTTHTASPRARPTRARPTRARPTGAKPTAAGQAVKQQQVDPVAAANGGGKAKDPTG